MTNEQILEQQVEALEKLLKLRVAITQELEAKIAKLEAEAVKTMYPGYSYPGWYMPQQIQPWVGGGSITITNTCPDGSFHEYDNGSICCKKCGSGQITTTTIANGTGSLTCSDNNVGTLINLTK
jgi:hypothetical protein